MYRTIRFEYLGDDEGGFDEKDEPVRPGARDLAQLLFDMFREKKMDPTEVEQHSYYGWAIVCKFEGSSFYNVVNHAGDECHITAEFMGYLVEKLTFRNPKKKFEEYCGLLESMLKKIYSI